MCAARVPAPAMGMPASVPRLPGAGHAAIPAAHTRRLLAAPPGRPRLCAPQSCAHAARLSLKHTRALMS